VETRPVGFVEGITAPFRGLGFLARSPDLWLYSIVPALVLIAVATVLASLGFVGVGSLVARFLEVPRWAEVLLKIVLYFVVIVFAVVIGFALAQPLSGPALDKIVEAQERAMGISPRPTEGTLRAMLRSLQVTLTSLAFTLPVLVLLTVVDIVVPAATVVTVPAKLVVSALMIAWDLLDYPMSRRQMSVSARIAWIRAHLGATLGFGLALAIVLLVPCVGLLLLPVGVAGATRLTIDAER
jgi:CysZ protein